MGDARQHVEQAGQLLDDIINRTYGQRDGRDLQLLFQAVKEQQAALASLVDQLEPRPFRTHSAETR